MCSNTGIIWLLVCVFSATYAKIPSYINVCHRDDPDLSKCIISSIEQLKPKLLEGIPELNIPSLDPLNIDLIKLRSGPKAAKLDANITNAKIFGASKFEVREFRPNLAKNRFVIRAYIPLVKFEGDYDIDMNVLVLQYKGVGPLHGYFNDFYMDGVMKGNKIMQDGKEYLKFDKMRIKLTVGKSDVILENLFKDDPILAQATKAVIEQNNDLFMNEIRPVLESAIEDFLTEVANKITLNFSYDELFP